jgi:Mn2+/Fe2+ NRAMP family transporter
LKNERGDVVVGAFVTNFIAFFIVIATAATLNATGQTDISDASQAAAALEPLAGRFAATLFAFGLFNAALLGSAALPLSTAYAASEAFGWEFGLDRGLRQAPIFYGIFIASLLIAALFVLIPGLSLVGVMFITQMVNGILLPIILIFALLIVNDKVIWASTPITTSSTPSAGSPSAAW